MTDKQIIIDNIDVSGCRYFEDGECLNPCETVANCEASPNCYYKRMMHTGAELNIHKTDKEHAYKRIAELQNQLKAKEQECEELKNTVDYLRREFKNIKWTNKAISKQCENLNCKDLQKLKQALDEIKEIANKFDYWNSNLSQASEILHEIIEKINECEGNDE